MDAKKLSQPIKFVLGVGPRVAKLLHRVGVNTVADALFFFPRRYQDFTQQKLIRDLVEGETAAVVGTVCDIDEYNTPGRSVLYVLIEQPGRAYLRAVWFNQPFMRARFARGQMVQFRGRVQRHGGRYQMTHPNVVTVDPNSGKAPDASLLPVYSLTEGIRQPQMRKIIAHVVDEYTDLVDESLPEPLRRELGLLDIHTAIRMIHHPQGEEELAQARRRFVFQELFILQLALASRRHQVRTSSIGAAMPMSGKVRSRILARFPFELTDSQLSAIDEIAADMASTHPMNRLVHGDVGSGKTVVALAAMLIAVANGYQATMMAPTEILARQHFSTVRKYLQHSRVRVGLCTGSMPSAKRRKLAEQVGRGEIDILVGTHALVNQEFQFPKLGLVVIDEQHKFGVRQRAQLRNQGFDPHYLVMTATPIPRTVSMTVFGDLDVSTLQLPDSRRRVVHTYLGTEDRRERWWTFFRKKLDQGRQGFVVAPLVESNEESTVESVDSMFETLTNGPLAEYRLGMIHGRQSADEKWETMRAFADGDIQVLVATGVIEVGIDVPNATVMTIESAERFGLSQLHQLRGRVGRGSHPGYVCAFASSQDPEAIERLKAFEACNDGFQLAQIDLELRGPGNLFGTRQTGFPSLMIADLIRDEDLLLTAREQAERLIQADSELRAPELARLRQLVRSRYGQALELSDVA